MREPISVVHINKFETCACTAESALHCSRGRLIASVLSIRLHIRSMTNWISGPCNMEIEQPRTNNGGYKTHGDGLMRSQCDLVDLATKGVVSSIVNKKRMNMKSANQDKKKPVHFLNVDMRTINHVSKRWQTWQLLAFLTLFYGYRVWSLLPYSDSPLTNVDMPQQVWCLLPMSTSSLIECSFCCY